MLQALNNKNTLVVEPSNSSKSFAQSEPKPLQPRHIKELYVRFKYLTKNSSEIQYLKNISQRVDKLFLEIQIL